MKLSYLTGYARRATPKSKVADVVTHRRQTGFQPDSGEQQRLGYAELAIDSHRAVITGYRASLYENQNDLDNAVKAYRLANTLNANLTGGSFALSGTYVALARIERERGNYAAAELPIETALAEAIRKNEAWGIANMLIFKSALRRDQGRLVESKQLAEDALKDISAAGVALSSRRHTANTGSH